MTRTLTSLALALCLLQPAASLRAQDTGGEAPRAQVLLFAARARGVDPAVPAFVDAALAREVVSLGYQPQPEAPSESGEAAGSATAPPKLSEVWRATYRSGAPYGVVAKVWAEGGRYVVDLHVACRDGRGPFHARGSAGAGDLAQTVASLLAQVLPPPSAAGSAAPPSANASPALASAGPALAASPPARAPVTSAPVEAAPSFDRFRLAAHTESAVGLSKDGFYDHLLGARVDYRLTPTLSLGGYLGYANLRGRSGRVGSLLYYVQLEQRVSLVPGSKLAIPLRFDLGYLIRNGSFLRIAPGLAIPLGERLEVVLDLFAPTFWLTPERSLFSLDFGVELAGTL